MKVLFICSILLISTFMYAQYNYGLQVEQQDTKIEGKLNLDSGSGNLFVGNEVGINSLGSGNSFFGYWSGRSNTLGSGNSFFGYKSGQNNIAIAANNAAGDLNSFFGFLSGSSNTTGYYNTYIGSNSGKANTTGSLNSFLGNDAGMHNTSGSSNTFVGRAAGFLNTTGNSNSFIGFEAGVKNISGERNCFMGKWTGYENTTGVGNSYFGYRAGNNNNTGSNNISIGIGSGPTQLNASQSFRLHIDVDPSFSPKGNDNPLIYGEFDNDLIRINGTLDVTETLHILEAAKLEPQALQPTGCNTQAMGTMYVNTGGVLYFCDGTAWKTVQLN